MEHFVESCTEVNGNSETHHSALPNRNGSFNARDNDKEGNTDTRGSQTSKETLKHHEMNNWLHEEIKVNSCLKMANGMADSPSHQLQDFVLDNKKENQNESQETELKLQRAKKRMTNEIRFQCDVEKSERREPAMILRNDGTSTSEREYHHKCSTERETRSEAEIRRDAKTLKDDTPMKAIQDDITTITGKLETSLHEKEVSLRKRVQELEMEIKYIFEQCEKEKREMQQKYDQAFLKLVGDNRRMNENLKEIQEHVRREKIESERTKNEVEQVLHERQKLVDQVKELTKGFESMIGERDRMGIVIETSISAFDSKLCEKDEEIRNLQETIDNDRGQFMEERDQYLTVIESLKAQLLLQEEQTRYSKAI